MNEIINIKENSKSNHITPEGTVRCASCDRDLTCRPNSSLRYATGYKLFNEVTCTVLGEGNNQIEVPYKNLAICHLCNGPVLRDQIEEILQRANKK